MPLVVDANLLVSLAIDLPYSEAAQARVEGWLADGESLFSPELWEYEATTSVRKWAVQRAVSSEEIERALLRLDALPVESVSTDAVLRRSALVWAARLGHFAAYDGFYVALAERLETELWTADGRLARGCQAAGAKFVRPLSSDD